MEKTINVSLPEEIRRKLNEYQDLVQAVKSLQKSPGKKRPNYADTICVFVEAALESPAFQAWIAEMQNQLSESYKAEIAAKEKQLAALAG